MQMSKSRVAGLLTLVGGLIVVVAGALTWAHVSGPNGTGRIVGRGPEYGVGGVLVVFGILVMALGFFRSAKVLLWVLALLNAAWTALLFGALQTSANDLAGPGSTYSISIGFILVMVGAVFPIIGAIVGSTAPGRTPSPAPGAPGYAPGAPGYGPPGAPGYPPPGAPGYAPPAAAPPAQAGQPGPAPQQMPQPQQAPQPMPQQPPQAPQQPPPA